MTWHTARREIVRSSIKVLGADVDSVMGPSDVGPPPISAQSCHRGRLRRSRMKKNGPRFGASEFIALDWPTRSLEIYCSRSVEPKTRHPVPILGHSEFRPQQLSFGRSQDSESSALDRPI